MGARGVIALVLIGGGGVLAYAIATGFNPLQAIQTWANSAGATPPEQAGSRASDPGNGSAARTSGGKAA